MAVMQFKRKVLILSLVAGALAVAYALGLAFSPTNVQRRRSGQPLLPGFKAEAVSRIEVPGPQDGTIEVVKEGKGWSLMIQGSPYPASEERVSWFLDSVGGLTRSRLVSSSPDSWSSFGVGKEARTFIRLSDAAGQRLLSLVVGSSEPGARGNYARLEDSNEVVLLNKSLGTYLEGSLSYWSHLKFFPTELTGGNINRISVRASLGFADGSSRKLAYTLIRSAEGGNKWRLVEPARSLTLDDQEVDRMATTLAGFEGNEFVPGNPDTGLQAPAAEVLFSTESNRDYRILIGGPVPGEQFYGKVDGGAYVYLVPEWRVKMITQPLEDLQQAAE